MNRIKEFIRNINWFTKERLVFGLVMLALTVMAVLSLSYAYLNTRDEAKAADTASEIEVSKFSRLDNLEPIAAEPEVAGSSTDKPAPDTDSTSVRASDKAKAKRSYPTHPKLELVSRLEKVVTELQEETYCRNLLNSKLLPSGLLENICE